MSYQNIKKVKAIELRNRQKLLELNQNLNDNSGIYFWTRTDEDGINYFYIGQAKHIIQRNCQHLVGYQHIDLSLKSRGLYSSENPFGWKLNYINYPEEKMDEMEQFWILEYTKKGYQCRYNKTSGSQNEGKKKINEFRPSKTYRDGLRQGRINMSREIKHIVDTHLVIGLKKETKTSRKALEKFWCLLGEEKESVDDGE